MSANALVLRVVVDSDGVPTRDVFTIELRDDIDADLEALAALPIDWRRVDPDRVGIILWHGTNDDVPRVLDWIRARAMERAVPTL